MKQSMKTLAPYHSNSGLAFLEILPLLALLFAVVSTISTINIARMRELTRDNVVDVFEEIVNEVSYNARTNCTALVGAGTTVDMTSGLFAYNSITLPISGGGGIIPGNTLSVNQQFKGFTITEINLFVDMETNRQFGPFGARLGWLEIKARYSADATVGSPEISRFMNMTFDLDLENGNPNRVQDCALAATTEDMCLLVGLHPSQCNLNRVTLITSLAACYNMCRYAGTNGTVSGICNQVDPAPSPPAGDADVIAYLDQLNATYGSTVGWVPLSETTTSVVTTNSSCNPNNHPATYFLNFDTYF